MNKWMKIGGGLIAALLLATGCVVVGANMAVANRMSQTFEAHAIDLPVPMPLSKAELRDLREKRGGLDGVDVDKIALKRAQKRGQHLVEARFACIECHGKDFGGGTMVDDPAMGTWLGPNLTTGAGSRTIGFTIADWDRIVRHGIKREGTPAIMPSEDFVGMSDRELTDIVAYIRTFPAVDKTVPAPTFGPIGTMLLASGALPLSAEHTEKHNTHRALPPKTEATATFGAHLVQVCTGCHRAELNGGPIPIGPPDWPPAGNLTPHASGIGSWSYEEFKALMVTGERPDGRPLKAPMTLMMPYAEKMTEVEMQALWAYLQSIPATPKGE